MRITRNFPMIVLAAAAAGALVVAAAHAAEPEFGLSVGYSQLSVDGNDSLDGQGGGRFEPRVSFQPFGDRPELRFGFALAFSYFYDEQDAGEIVLPPFDFDVDVFQDVFLFTPEFQVSWRQPLSKRWWIEGGIGAGLVFGYYSAGEVFFDDEFDTDVTEDDFGFELRPFLRAAWQGDHWHWGAEASYQYTTIDFGGPLGGDVSEWYAGLFLGFRK